jgi:hypothetical protein
MINALEGAIKTAKEIDPVLLLLPAPVAIILEHVAPGTMAVPVHVFALRVKPVAFPPETVTAPEPKIK